MTDACVGANPMILHLDYVQQYEVFAKIVGDNRLRQVRFLRLSGGLRGPHFTFLCASRVAKQLDLFVYGYYSMLSP